MIHLVTEHFADDAQDVADPEWIGYGLRRGWALLTQDARIRRQPAALEPLRLYRGSMFCLSSAELSVRARADRFQSHRDGIYSRAASGMGGFFAVHENRLVKMRI